jgi:hypothetical protein
MHDEHAQVEFLDPEDRDGHDSAEDVAWLDEEGLGTHRGLLLPPLTTARRLTVSLAVFALGLSLTGFSGFAAYRHDQNVAAEANALILREVNVGDAVTLTDPGQFGGANGWRLEPSAAISIGVTNESPDSITLMPGATLTGPGIAAPSTLTPAGTSVLAPGQSGRLTGSVTVDCGMQVQGAKGADAVVKGENSVLVQARTASGAVGFAELGVGQSADAVRQQICTEQGDSMAASFFPISVDGATHSFTVGVSAHSLAAQPLKYWVSASFSEAPETILDTLPSLVQVTLSDGKPVDTGSLSAAAVDALLPGVQLTDAAPLGPVEGTMSPGASTSTAFAVHVRSCPSSPPTSNAELNLNMFLDDHGQPAYFQADSFELDTLIASACDLTA